MLIHVAGGFSGSYGRFWANLGEIRENDQEFLEAPERFGLVCFTGGSDVSPELYGHENLGSSNSPARDEHERRIFDAAFKQGLPMTGICRGAQILNVLLGGTMVQHLRRSHGGSRHMCQTFDGKNFEVTSSHHQMIVPAQEGEILAWADQRLGIEDCLYHGNLPESVLDQDIETIKEEGEPLVRVTEAIAYPEHRIFAVQHHPEWQNIDDEGPQWTLKMIREICLGEKAATA